MRRRFYLKCPNCLKKMIFTKQRVFDKQIYDKWNCEDCIHIIVLDYRGKRC